MKKRLFFLGFAIAGTMLFSSCNKKLKEDLKAMDAQVKGLQSQNSALQNQLNEIESLVLKEPLNLTTRFRDNNGVLRTVTHSYRIQNTSDTYNNYMREWEDDGIYEVKVRRIPSNNLDYEEMGMVRFYFDSNTGLAVRANDWELRHYWGGFSNNYNTDAYYNGSSSEASATVTIHSYNLNSGHIKFTVDANATDNYDNGTMPNSGKATTTTVTFEGNLYSMSYDQYQNLRVDNTAK